MQGKKHYSEKLFKQFQLSDRVPADNFYRCLKEMLELQWLYKATKNYYGTEGQQNIFTPISITKTKAAKILSVLEKFFKLLFNNNISSLGMHINF